MNKKRLFIFKQALTLFMVLCSVWGWGQTTESFETGLPSTYNSSLQTATLGTGIWQIRDVIAGTTGVQTGTKTAQIRSATNAQIITPTLSGGVGLVSFYVTSSTASGAYQVNVSSDNGVTWTPATGSPFTIGTTKTLKSITINSSTINKIQVYRTGGTLYIDDFTWTGYVPTCTAASASFTPIVVNKTTSDAPFTNTFTTNNTSPTVYSSSKTNVATVDSSTGEVTIAGAGSTTISVTQAADGTRCAVSASYTLNVTSAAPSLAISGTANHGPVCIGTPASVQTYTVTNTGNSAAAGLSVTSDNPQFVVSNISSTTVNGVNGTVTFDVTFTPAAAGAQNAALTVTSTTSGSNTATYQITGTGNPTVAPAVAVGNADVTNDAATLHGNVTSLGSCLASPIVNRGFVYTVFSSPEINGGTYVNEGTSATGAFSVNISGLVPAKIYFYKAFVVDAAGQYYYSPTEGTFTTSLATPVATAATNVTPVGFTANWNAVNGAEGYNLDVYMKAGAPATTITETFSNIGNSSSSYADYTWTGDGSIEWTATNSRNDQAITTGNRAITLRDATSSKLESGIMQNGLTNISFDVKQVFSGSGGVLTIKVLTGPTFATVTTIGTHAYNTTVSTYNSGVISGITGDFKILVENNASARPAIDNLSFTSLATFTKTYVAGYENLNVGNVTSKEVTGLNPESTYYYVVRAVSGAVTSANSNEIEVTTLGTPTWNGTAWSNTNGPDASTPAIIDGDYEGPAITAQSLTVNAGKTLTVNNYVSVSNVTNNGNILVADGANFVQTGTFTAGAGSSFKVRKDSKPVKRLAYINWSSPMAVSTQTLKDFSYGKKADGSNQSATGTVDNRFFTYNNNTFVSISPTTTFEAGAGYQIRTPNDFTTTPQVFHGQFEGTTPNTGAISVPHNGIITGDYVLLGNPYPSAISISDFLTHNPGTQGTFYIWNSGAEMIDNAYGGGNYNTYAPNTGSVPAGSINGYIPVGQGFFIKRGAAIAPFVFTNAMRQTMEDGVFSKAATADKFWLELTAPSGSKPQMLIGFNAAATAGYDAGFDAALFGTNADALYSEVNGTKLVIDAHGTFSSDDTFALKADLSAAGNYTIGILKSEGVFASGQQIWLKDQLTGTTTLISEQPYAFSADAGTLANRFVLQFKPGGALATDSAVKSDIKIYSAGSEVHAKSSENITSLNVYDMSGRMIAKAPAAQKEIVLNVAYKGVVLVKAQLANGTVKTTKLMLK